MFKKWRELDYIILLIVGIFMAVSTIAIYSATNLTKYEGLHMNNLLLYGVSGILVCVLALIDYRIFVRKLSYLLYGIGIVFLIYVMFQGVTINGSRRWINLAFIQFQPSELVKIALILVIAKLQEKRQGDALQVWSDILPITLFTAVPFVLVLMQPDLGTAIVFISIYIGMLWSGNIRIKHIAVGAGTAAAIVGLIVALYYFDFNLFSKIVKPHQLERIQTFLDPGADPNSAWHVMNSLTAVGVGQLFGKGFQHGFYTQNGFIPYNYADSIYVVIGEEFGFAGSALLLILFFLLFYRMIRIASECKDLSGSYIVVGVISMLTLQIFENIAMHIGMMPMTGIALPFISYGGSSLLTNMIAVGLVLSVRTHRNRHDIP
ncbi:MULTISPECIES: FtsW/RodA/SpoVE family cell cycle protein [unclassified Paenibacillus]|uniref:FtsW/RodA/SpoVE family cell cycle protein n=1 Tax=unclassified Paenibacillus TaxID=185978 RepID=UPI001C10E2CD|nr:MULTISPECIES: FtsW/RodA/SpoVE family cell cycle protein [unclassified Paenibacillus]MBU5441376.1 rod shape-determining protein RodA [Paenibacillus sp. MSJ-34]CAH0118241.1 Peptidoglycan glycosyltransferase MrdB [Paenibacillus sp. CECT 9249]